MINTKKKIAVILPNLNNGGAERSHIYIANEWNKLGYNVTFVLLEKKGRIKKPWEAGLCSLFRKQV